LARKPTGRAPSGSEMRRSFIDRLLLPVIFGLSTIVFSLLLWQLLLTHQHVDIEAAAAEQASFVKTKTESEIRARIVPLERLAERWQSRGGASAADMKSDAGLVISEYPSYRAIEWVDPSFRPVWVITGQTSDSSVGASLAAVPGLPTALREASRSRKTAIAPTVDLQQTGRGFLVCVPMYRRNRLGGFLVGAFAERELLSSVLQDVATDYWVSIYDGDRVAYSSSAAEPPQTDQYVREANITFRQLSWRAVVWPKAGAAAYARSSLPMVVFIAGILMALVLAFAVYMAETAHLNVKGLEAANTELEREVASREQAEAALRQAQKMEAIGRLAGGVAHDFNNLLVVIRGQALLSRARVGPASPIRRELDEIVKTADRASSLTRKLLAFGRKQVLQPRVLDLNEQIKQIADILPSVLGADIKLHLALDADLGNIKADAPQLEQVIMNLVLNARDAMPDGGELAIQTANRELDGEWSRRHPGTQPGPYVMLAVCDTGHGMNDETQSHLFEPFFTTKDTSKGSGLGLATVYGTVNQSGGCVTVLSKLGAGTAIQIYLPRVDDPVDRVEEPSPAETELKGEEKILVVEDDDAVRRMAREFLKLKGYTVVEMRSAAEAIHWLESHDEKVDLVLTDLIMPGMKGRELVGHLANLRPSLKALYMSAYTEDYAVSIGVLDPGVAFIEKSFSPDDLAAKVREVLHGRSQAKVSSA
jgi:signal transduction histidine kinase/ActR/RegA family two-component response regulator